MFAGPPDVAPILAYSRRISTILESQDSLPRPNSRAEDDGWLVTCVRDEGSGTSELTVIEAQDFSAPPVARVRIPARVPYGFQGAWIPGEMLAKG
jgi:carotenoid cleavage dioxygenase-like enzyme